MTKKRIFKYACLCLSFVCAMFLCVNVVFAAVKQKSTCSVTIDYEPGIKAIVEVIITDDNGVEKTQVIFDNTGTNTVSENPYYFSVNTAGNTIKLHPSNAIQFQVTNKTEKDGNGVPITALVRLATTTDNVTIPQNVSLYDDNNEPLSYKINNVDVVNATQINLPSTDTSLEPLDNIQKDVSAQSTIFHIQTLFSETVPFVVELKLV